MGNMTKLAFVAAAGMALYFMCQLSRQASADPRSRPAAAQLSAPATASAPPSITLDGQDPKAVNREMNGRGMQVVDPQTKADADAVAEQYTYKKKVKSRWIRERKYTTQDIADLKVVRQGLETYLKTAPASDYKKFYLRLHFDNCIELIYFLEGKDAAVRWSAANAGTLGYMSADDVTRSTGIVIHNLDTVFGPFGWKLPLNAS